MNTTLKAIKNSSLEAMQEVTKTGSKDSPIDNVYSLGERNFQISMESIMELLKAWIYSASIIFYAVMALIASTDTLIRHLIFINFMFFNAFIKEINGFRRLADAIKKVEPIPGISEFVSEEQIFMCALVLISGLVYRSFNEQNVNRKIQMLGNCFFTYFIFYAYFIYDVTIEDRDVTVHAVSTLSLQIAIYCFFKDDAPLLTKLKIIFVDILRRYLRAFAYLNFINYGLYMFFKLH